MSARTSLTSSVLVALLVAACTVGPDHEAPELEMPSAWSQPAGSGLDSSAADESAWWLRFDDPLLAELVERALEANLDLEIAARRLDEARALRGIAAGERLPALEARGAYEHRRESENTPFGAFSSTTDTFSAGFDASWEIDLFGRVRRSVEAATRDLEAAAEDVAAASVSVAAETALAYVELRSSQRRLAIALTNVDLQEQTVALVRSRHEAGLVGERDVAQAATNVESTRSRVPSLEADVSAAARRIAVLLGVAPGTNDALLARLDEPASVPRPVDAVAVGLPADLVRARPDVRAAERRFAVELARTQYGEGLSDFQAVLDSQRIVAALEDDLAVSDAAVSANVVALHKALGGGAVSSE